MYRLNVANIANSQILHNINTYMCVQSPSLYLLEYFGRLALPKCLVCVFTSTMFYSFIDVRMYNGIKT